MRKEDMGDQNSFNGWGWQLVSALPMLLGNVGGHIPLWGYGDETLVEMEETDFDKSSQGFLVCSDGGQLVWMSEQDFNRHFQRSGSLTSSWALDRLISGGNASRSSLLGRSYFRFDSQTRQFLKVTRHRGDLKDGIQVPDREEPYVFTTNDLLALDWVEVESCSSGFS